MSWCRLSGLTPVMSATSKSNFGRYSEESRRSNLLQQVASFLNRKRLHQVLLGGSQNSQQANHQQITNQICPDVLGPPADVFLLEMGHPFADGSFDLALCFHERAPSSSSERQAQVASAPERHRQFYKKR